MDIAILLCALLGGIVLFTCFCVCIIYGMVFLVELLQFRALKRKTYGRKRRGMS